MIKKLLTISFIAFLGMVPCAYAETYSKFDTVIEAIDQTTDYLLESNRLELISEQPLHIRVSPVIMKDDYPAIIDEELKRALVRTVLRAFIHTNVDQVKVTIQPQLIESYNPYKANIVDSPKYSIDITRSQALAVMKRLLNIESFDQLVGGKYMPDEWNPAINHIFYNDQEKPTLNDVFKALGAK